MISTKIKTKKFIIPTAAVLVLASGGAYAFSTRNDNKPTDSPISEGVNYGPPTEEEQNAGDEQKERIIEQEAQRSQPAETANVVIADANQYGNQIEVRAFVTNAIKTGTCTFTFSKGDNSFTKKTDAFKDASTSQCGALNVPRSTFPSSGMWNVLVKFDAQNISGQAQQSFEVR